MCDVYLPLGMFDGCELPGDRFPHGLSIAMGTGSDQLQNWFLVTAARLLLQCQTWDSVCSELMGKPGKLLRTKN